MNRGSGLRQKISSGIPGFSFKVMLDDGKAEPGHDFRTAARKWILFWCLDVGGLGLFVIHELPYPIIHAFVLI